MQIFTSLVEHGEPPETGGTAGAERLLFACGCPLCGGAGGNGREWAEVRIAFDGDTLSHRNRIEPYHDEDGYRLAIWKDIPVQKCQATPPCAGGAGMVNLVRPRSKQ